MGLFNTNDKKHFFRIKAIVNNKTLEFSKVDWKLTTFKNFRIDSEDFEIHKRDLELTECACILY
jgi:hypothetical protein